MKFSRSGLSVKELFLAAMEIESLNERDTYLRQECINDEELQKRVKHLIEIDQGEDDLLKISDYPTLHSEREAVMEQLHTDQQFIKTLGEDVLSIGDYDLIQELGRGATGIVFQATQKSLNRSVAVKIITGSSLASSTERERFRIEAEATANLNHPNIVPIYEIGQHEEHDFYSMRLITGGTLTGHITTLGQNRRDCVHLMLKVIRAVQAAHENGILHRDLKPDNILLDDEGEPHIVDFGLAHRLEQESSLTLPGQIVGTPQYMAPEQAEGGGQHITTTADIYSLGNIFYELLAGTPVFKGDSVLTTLQMVKEDAPKPLSFHAPGIDRDLKTIVHKCLEKNPASRYPSARTLAEDCEAWLAHRPISARPPTAVERMSKWVRRRPMHAALVAISSLLILTLGIGGPITAYRQAKLRGNAERASQLAEDRATENRELLYYANMSLGGNTLFQPGGIRTLNELLESWQPSVGEPDLREWEWYFLSSAKDESFTSHSRPGIQISALSPSPSGKLFASVSRDQAGITIHDLENGSLVRTIETPIGYHHVAWGPDGSRLGAAGQKTLYLWDPHTGKLLGRRHNPHTPEGRAFPPISLDWVAQSRQLVSVGRTANIFFWNPENLTLQEKLNCMMIKVDDREPERGTNWAFKHLRISPGGTKAAYVGESWKHEVYIYVKSLEAPAAPALALGGHLDQISALAWNPNNRQLASGSHDKVITVWDTERKRPPVHLNGHTGRVSTLAWNPKGQTMASGSFNGEIKIWDMTSHLLLEDVVGHSAEVSALSWSPDGETLISGDASGVQKTWRTDGTRACKILYQHPSHGFRYLCWNPEGSQIACSALDGSVQVIDAHTGKLLDDTGIPKVRVPLSVPLRWSPDGSSLLLHTANRELILFDLETRKPRLTLTPPASDKKASNFISATFSNTGNKLATVTYFGRLMIWDLESSQLIHEFPENHKGTLSLSWSDDHSFLLTSGQNSMLASWHWPSKKQLRHRQKESQTHHYIGHSWAPDSSMVAIGNHNGTVTILDQNLNIIHQLQGHNAGALSTAWHPSGTRLATGSGDQTVKIWDIKSGKCTLTLRGHASDVDCVAWSSDGLRLASAGRDSTIRIWDATRAYQIETSRKP